jgi:hypothetical protein
MGIECTVGYSVKKDTAQAAEEALEKCRPVFKPGKSNLLICFSSVAFDQDKLAAGLYGEGGAQMVGCSDAGGIVTDGPHHQAVSAMGISADNIKFSVGVGEHIEIDARQAGKQMAEAIKAKDPKVKLIMMLADGLAGNGADIVRGILDVMGSKFPVVGGAAGDDFLFKKTYEYLNGKVLNNSVVGVGFSGDFSFGIGVRHGWMPIGLPMQVTRSKANVLMEIDGKPAVSIYEDYFGEEKAKKLREEPLARMAITYPLGIASEASDEYLVRDAISVDEKGALTCAAEIPEGSTIRLMIGSKDEAISAARTAAHQAKDGMKGKKIKAAIIFNCIARDKLFGRDADEEILAIRQVLGNEVPLIGFYTYGEQAPVAGKIHECSTVFHNETVVILTLGE